MTDKELTITLTEVEQETLRIIHERNVKGRQTYGKGLDHTDTEYDWLDMTIEECADMLKYLIAEKLRRQAIKRRTVKKTSMYY